jgi:arylsulfatase A-like enzyme
MVLTSEACTLDTHFDYYDDYIDNKEPYRDIYERNARSTTDAGILWLLDQYDPNKPYFLWLHYQDTHGPYHPPPDKPVEFSHPEPLPVDIDRIPFYIRELRPRSAGRDYRTNPLSLDERYINDALAYIDRYDEELAYADFHIHRLLKVFEEQGLLKNTLVIFSADHGESMIDHEQWFTHSYHIYEELAHVPLLIRYPNQKKNVRVKTRVSLVDLLPTILDLVGIDRPAELRGKPLSKPFGMTPLHTQGMEWRSMIYDHKKWVIEYGDKQEVPARRRVYDLLKDPGEFRPLEWIDSAEADAFYTLVAADPDPGGIPEEFAKGMRMIAPKVRPGLDRDTIKKLRSLGYVE